MRLASPTTDAPIRIGVSSCLLGHEVRYDGGHARDPFLTETLGRFVEWVPVCPELEVGLGVPRPTLHLERASGGLHLIQTDTGRDHTRAMRAFARRRVAELRRLGLYGFVLKRGSPSCGLERVKVHAPRARPRRWGRGLFAAGLLEAMPGLPVEEEGRLGDPLLRDNFVERVFAYRRLRRLFSGRWTPTLAARFHAAHELQLLAHSAAAHGELTRLVAEASDLPRGRFRQRYEDAFMMALAQRATPGRNARVLRRMTGRLRRGLRSQERAELAEAIGAYRRGRAPLLVPLTLIRHHARRLAAHDLLGQLYLEPEPTELMLRYHV
jgi:uncharacterized protein YbbK (DUF523 family)/uncharacterized protein YbgA (DUF1722 family)